MKTPEHHFINEYGQHEIKRMWLGSGVTDKNGKEIFEGGLVNCGSIDGVMTVVFNRGVFCLENHIETYELPDCKADTLEIIGHIAENGK